MEGCLPSGAADVLPGCLSSRASAFPFEEAAPRPAGGDSCSRSVAGG
ncbi:MAG: hypothetical protein LM577_04905 [Thermoproteaceae archaeon]|nr:hypothetical protein [Thermoproteaceae archaeon]